MSLVPAIILIVVAAIAGYVIGIVDSRITAALQKKNEESKAAEASQASAAAVAEEKSKLGEHTVLKVSIDEALKWHLELDGKQADNPSEISAEQRQRLINLIVQIKPWLDAKPAPASEPAPAAMPAAPAAPAETITASKPVALPPAPTTAAPATPTPPRVDPLRGLRSLLNNEIKAPGQVKTTSIVAMIDDVLQAKLLSTPFSNRGIRLEEGPLGEVVVIVDRSRYNGVDAVPDEDIRALIKSAISDWEKR